MKMATLLEAHTCVTNSGFPFAIDSKYLMPLTKLSHELWSPPLCAFCAKYGKLLIMKKSTASATAEMSPELCQPYAMSEIDTGMSASPAFLRSDFSSSMYFARLLGDPASLSYKGYVIAITESPVLIYRTSKLTSSPGISWLDTWKMTINSEVMHTKWNCNDEGRIGYDSLGEQKDECF